MEDPQIYSLFDKNLNRIGEVRPLVEIDPSMIISGSLLGILGQNIGNLNTGKSEFTNSETGYILGVDDGVAKFYIGNSTNYLNWDGTTLTISGSLTVSSGMIGGFDIGSDYIRDSANSMGLASTVTGGDDVRFWAGDTFANRSTAPFRVTESGALVATSATISGYSVTQIGTFGGDGSDGALAISSGTTTIDLGGAAYVVKNYTSISITGTGKLAFSNPAAAGTIIILKSQGGVTLTSSTAPMVDCTNTGASGGEAKTRTTVGNTDGDNGTDGTRFGWLLTDHGDGSTETVVGVGGATGNFTFTTAFYTNPVALKYPQVFVGAGGGSGDCDIDVLGGITTISSGAGGRGGGGLIIECAGALNFTTSGGISVGGSNGTNASVSGSGGGADGNAAGGGGGGGGSCIVLYNDLTAASGTIAISGGTGGNAANVGGSSSQGPGGGGSGFNAGVDGTSTSSNNVKNGGNGGDGNSLVVMNTIHA